MWNGGRSALLFLSISKLCGALRRDADMRASLMR
jgi:hypothetical protein